MWFIACMCLLHPTLASFSLATNDRRGCAIPPSRTIRHVQVPVYEAKGCCTRVGQFIYGYNCVLINGLHCASKQLTPCDIAEEVLQLVLVNPSLHSTNTIIAMMNDSWTSSTKPDKRAPQLLLGQNNRQWKVIYHCNKLCFFVTFCCASPIFGC